MTACPICAVQAAKRSLHGHPAPSPRDRLDPRHTTGCPALQIDYDGLGRSLVGPCECGLDDR